MAIIEGSPEFQLSCVALLRRLLEKHGYGAVRFDYFPNDNPRYVAKIDVRGQQHEIEVYQTGPVMVAGAQLFEPYMPEEFESEAALEQGFATRLERYLDGGAWEGPDELGFLGSVVKRLSKFIRR